MALASKGLVSVVVLVVYCAPEYQLGDEGRPWGLARLTSSAVGENLVEFVVDAMAGLVLYLNNFDVQRELSGSVVQDF